MKVTFWGTRGSLASPSPDTVRYGGNTSCVSVEGAEGSLIVLDAGTGLRNLGQALPQDLKQVHILLTHLHMDHIQGLPFFAPLRRKGAEVHLWGPASTTLSLDARLQKYLSPPLFPVSIRELAAREGCGTHCGWCVAYLRRALRTGETVFHEILAKEPL